MENQFENGTNPEQEPVRTYQAPQQEPSPRQEPDPQPRFVEQAPKKTRRAVGIPGLIAVALCCSILGGLLGAGIMALLPQKQQPAQEPEVENHSQMLAGLRENSILDINQIDTSRIMTPAEVYAANVNSTVGITTSITTNYWGYQTTAAASGSGFILTEDGYILTNYHVVDDSSAISVSFFNGDSLEATLIGYDESNDIAILKVEATGLTPVIIGDSDNTNVGDSVVAIGNPLGELTFSLTAGTVSALDRSITMSNGSNMNLVQTDCAINSGNSGGALFNLHGEVIGITNAKYSSSTSSGASIDNIGFAIPVNDVWTIIQSIIENGYISKPYIGISVTNVSTETQSYGLPKGAAVRAVAEDSPAQQGGLQVNDIITAINGTEISGSSDLVALVGDAAIGDVLNLTVFRQGATVELTVTVGEQIQSALEAQPQQPQQQQPQGSQIFPGWGFGSFFN